MKEPGLVRGECCFKDINVEKFIEVEQNGRELHFRFKHSRNGKFIVVWKTSLNPTRDKDEQVCLIENKNNVLWCEEFERVWNCDVANNGTVAVLVHNLVPAHDIHNRPGFLEKNSIIIIPKGRDKFQLKFSASEEIMALAISPSGAILIYNLQHYRPDDYQLVLYNIHHKQEGWRYKYPKKQVVHELIFKDNYILVYAGPRPSAHVDRKYSFTLDLAGKIVSDDLEESRKQEERDSLAARADDLAGQVGRILREALADLVPTIEVTRRLQHGARVVSRGLSDIMGGRRPLPALHIMITPDLHRFFPKPSRAKIEEQGCRFFFHMQVIARTTEERDTISKDCVQTLMQQEGNLEKKGLVFETKLHSRIIGHYPGSGFYLRTAISCMLIFPAKQRIRQRARSWRDLLNLQSDESIVITNEIFVKLNQFPNFDGKLVLTTKRLVILIKNPISDQFMVFASLSPEKARNIVFGGKDEKYIVRQGAPEETRVYFKPGQNGDFEAFRKEFESFKKRGHAS